MKCFIPTVTHFMGRHREHSEVTAGIKGFAATCPHTELTIPHENIGL